MEITNVTPKGQVTIPKALRDKYGLLPYMGIYFEDSKNGIILKKATRALRKKAKKPSPRAAAIKNMIGKGMLGMTTDEIMRLTRGEE